MIYFLGCLIDLINLDLGFSQGLFLDLRLNASSIFHCLLGKSLDSLNL